MQHIDITIDLETLSLASNAAIVQMVAIPWDRQAAEVPFIDIDPFVGFVDVRSCIKDGFTIDERTTKWWQQQDEAVREAVFTGEAHALPDILDGFSKWIEMIMGELKATSLCLWAQGSDFDISVLRTAFARYNMRFPVRHDFFRDARTFIIENGAYFCLEANPMGGICMPKKVYEMLGEIPDIYAPARQVHNAEFDARRTTWNVWQILKKLQHLSSLTGGVVTSLD